MSSEVISNNGILIHADAARTVLQSSAIPEKLRQQVESADGSHAIEVAALFDNTVLDVRHFDNPSGGRLSGLTKGLLGSAGAALIGTFALFADSYIQVVHEKATEQKAHHQKDSGRARDAAAFGLLSLGAGALLYGLHRGSSERRENEFSIGTAPGATFKLDSGTLPAERFPLVRSTGTEYEFLFAESMSGTLSVNGKTQSLAELKEQARPAAGIAGALAVAIPEGARLSVEHQGCTFLIRSVQRPRHYPVPMRIDWNTQAYTGAVMVGAATMMALMFMMPPDPRSLALDGFTNEQLAHYMVKAPEVKEDPAPWLKKLDQTAESKGGKAANGPTGKAGKPEAARRNDTRTAIPGPKTNEQIMIAKERAKELVQNIGVVGIINSGQVKGLTALFGAQNPLGNDAVEALAGLDGQATTDAYGVNAMGLVGVGRGGPGTSDGTIGLTGIGPFGSGGPRGKYGNGPTAKLRDRVAKAPDWVVGPAQVSEGLDKDLIRRVIRQHMNEVKYCYEKELARDNSLNGRVVVKFAIGGMGSVTTSYVEASTLNNQGADMCIANAVRRWQFPKPQGSLVMVSYPFILKPAGE